MAKKVQKEPYLDYRKNEMLDELLQRYYATYSYTLDTIELVGEKTNKKIHKYILKNMKKSWRKLDKKYNGMLRSEWWKAFKQKIRDYFERKKQKRLEKKAKRKALKLARQKAKRKQKQRKLQEKC